MAQKINDAFAMARAAQREHARRAVERQSRALFELRKSIRFDPTEENKARAARVRAIEDAVAGSTVDVTGILKRREGGNPLGAADIQRLRDAYSAANLEIADEEVPTVVDLDGNVLSIEDAKKRGRVDLNKIQRTEEARLRAMQEERINSLMDTSTYDAERTRLESIVNDDNALGAHRIQARAALQRLLDPAEAAKVAAYGIEGIDYGNLKAKGENIDFFLGGGFNNFDTAEIVESARIRDEEFRLRLDRALGIESDRTTRNQAFGQLREDLRGRQDELRSILQAVGGTTEDRIARQELTAEGGSNARELAKEVGQRRLVRKRRLTPTTQRRPQ